MALLLFNFFFLLSHGPAYGFDNTRNFLDFIPRRFATNCLARSVTSDETQLCEKASLFPLCSSSHLMRCEKAPLSFIPATHNLLEAQLLSMTQRWNASAGKCNTQQAPTDNNASRYALNFHWNLLTFDQRHPSKCRAHIAQSRAFQKSFQHSDNSSNVFTLSSFLHSQKVN